MDPQLSSEISGSYGVSRMRNELGLIFCERNEHQSGHNISFLHLGILWPRNLSKSCSFPLLFAFRQGNFNIQWLFLQITSLRVKTNTPTAH